MTITERYMNEARCEAQKIDLSTLRAVEMRGGYRLVSSRGEEQDFMSYLDGAGLVTYEVGRDVIVGTIEEIATAVEKVK